MGTYGIREDQFMGHGLWVMVYGLWFVVYGLAIMGSNALEDDAHVRGIVQSQLPNP
ncbi:hypothetical protein T484DRAFT_1943704 [Baffinella frigidus]|nr:hypothetical protein T484DRAFT_1943704 [Cryptophyta sp. CCMP2293]